MRKFIPYEEDYLRLDRIFPGSDTEMSNLATAVRRAEKALSIAVGHVIGDNQEIPPDWTWQPKRSTNELALQAYQRRPLRDRALNVTDDGLVGLGPGVTQPGDELCYIMGRSVPCLLRRLPELQGEGGEGKYQFVGEVWVYGLMDGEAMADGYDSPNQADTPSLTKDDSKTTI